MSRGPRDLRDLICVSRLTFRESDDEVLSDEEFVRGDLDEISLGSSESCDSRQGFVAGHKQKDLSPDSGCIITGGSPLDSNITHSKVDTDLKLDLSVFKQKRKSKRKKKKKVLETEVLKFPFPKPPPLPPLGRSVSADQEGNIDEAPSNAPVATTAKYVGSQDIRLNNENSSQNKSIGEDYKVKISSSVKFSDDIDEESALVCVGLNSTGAKTYRVPAASHAESGDYDDMLCYMDATVVSGWLARANKNVSDVASYINADDNFIQFAHFWLTDFPDTQKREIFELEIEILREELGFAFASGRDEGTVSHKDISNLIGAIFREYPLKLVGPKGSFLFLDYLDTVTSGRTQKYKKLLSDVKCSTKNPQYAQWLLATRSFALVSMWCAIVNFYRNLLGRHGNVAGNIILQVPSTFKTVYEKRLFQALRRGFTDVVHYLHIGEYVDIRMIDGHERTLIFTAVMHNQPKLLKYLVTRVKPAININLVSDTGNTALHAAVNNGSGQLVSVLLKCAGIDINCVNRQCENASPLHLAVVHGHKEVVQLLMKAGADTSLRMGGLTPVDIARDFDRHEILELFQPQ